MENKIRLKVRSTEREERRCVQISGAANTVLNELHRATGLPVGHIVSQIIIQGAEFVKIVEEK